MKLTAKHVAVNGRTALDVQSFDDEGNRLPYGDKIPDVRPRAVREKMAAAIVKDNGCTEETARAAVQQLYLTVEQKVDAAADLLPPAESLETLISARLPELVDVVADGEGQPVYLFVNDAGIVTAQFLDLDGIRHVPPQLVHFPYKLPVEEDVRGAFRLDSDAELFADLMTWHKRASKLPDEAHYQLTALFVLLTWLADRVDYATYLTMESRDPERGKTRWGQAAAWVCYRGIHTETLQEANLFRWSDSLQATLFIDVRDLWRKAEKRGSDDILLSRFQRNGPKVARVQDPQAGPFKGVTYYDCYGPTLLAINESLPEPMASRILGIVPPEAAGRYPTLQESDAMNLKARCAAFRARHLLEPLPTADKPADGRLGDIMQPLALMAEIIGGDLPDLFPNIVESFRAARQAARAETFEARIIAAVQKAIDDGHMVEDVIPTADVLPLVNDGLPENRQFTAQRLGLHLRNLGFDNAKVPGKAGQRGRIIELEQMDALKRKYGLDQEITDSVENTPRHKPPQPPQSPSVGVAQAQGDLMAAGRLEADNSGQVTSVATQAARHGLTPAQASGATEPTDVQAPKTPNVDDDELSPCAGCKTPLAVEDIDTYDDVGDPLCFGCSVNEGVEPNFL